MKKAVPYILFGSLLVYLIIVLTFASAEEDTVKCKGVQVFVDNSEGNAFIGEEDIHEIIRRNYGDVTKMNVVDIDKDSMEHVICRASEIKSAQVYYSLDGYIHVNVTQRVPVLRIVSGKGYYVDEEGKMMPLSSKYTARVMVATGNISQQFACQQLYPFVMKLKEDKLWQVLVEQIVVSGKEVSLIPKVGNFRIVLGRLEGVEQKMENLRLFLEKGIALKGWNIYKEINLKFENQIVCVKR